MLAATALVHNLTIVTRNVRGFEEFGVATVNPWEGEP
jgi:predicted nucleic acid-binding protein